MALLKPGHWQTTHWPSGHWHEDHWQDYAPPGNLYIEPGTYKAVMVAQIAKAARDEGENRVVRDTGVIKVVK